jgi:hypothetical protein
MIIPAHDVVRIHASQPLQNIVKWLFYRGNGLHLSPIYMPVMVLAGSIPATGKILIF